MSRIDRTIVNAEKNLYQENLYKEAYETIAPLLLNSKASENLFPRALEICVNSLRRLNRYSETDAFLDGVFKAHPNRWRILYAVSENIDRLECYGTIRDNQFIRGEGRWREFPVRIQDRLRVLQIMSQAAPLLEAERASGTVSAEEIYDFYSFFARRIGQWHPEAWELQKLTDLSQAPNYLVSDYDIEDDSIHSEYAPVDAEGQPVFFFLPESFESAKNDGERWRFLLKKASEAGPEYETYADFTLAKFLQEQFGPQTLRDYRFFAPENFDEEDDLEETENNASREGVWSLASLTDDEAIAKLAIGVRRFALPEGQSYLRLYQKVMETDPGDSKAAQVRRYGAAKALTREYLNRRQYVQAEKYLRLLSEMKADLPKREQEETKKVLDQITGNYGSFLPIATQLAGGSSQFDWKYRNGSQVRFTAQRIDLRSFLDDMKTAVQKQYEEWNQSQGGNDQNYWEEWKRYYLGEIGQRLLDDPEMAKKYLVGEAKEWTVDLSPLPNHQDQKATIAFPFQERGLYLLRGEMQEGNADAILIELSEWAILKKELDGENLWQVVNARTGEPIPNANLRFTKSQRNKPVPLQEWTIQTDANGIYRQTKSDFSSSANRAIKGGKRPRMGYGPSRDGFDWLVEASLSGEEGQEPRALYGWERMGFMVGRPEKFSRLRAFFISDRPIYRPGDAIHFQFRVGKAEYDSPEVWTEAGKKVRLIVTDPGGTVLLDKKTVLDETGTLEETLETNEDFHLGSYQFSLNLDVSRSSDHYLGSGSIRLEEYRKPEFEVVIDAPNDPVRLGDKIKAKVRANYYFGAPVTEAKVKYTVVRTAAEETWFPFRMWDWLYGNGYGWLGIRADWLPSWPLWGICPPRWAWIPFHRPMPETVCENTAEIGPDGTFNIEIDTSLAKEIFPNDDQRYEITAEVTDASRRTIVGEGIVLASKRPYRVYAWTDRGFYEPDRQIDASIQTRRLDGKPVAGEAQVTLYKIAYEKDAENPAKIVPVETEVFTREEKVDAEGKANFSFVLKEAGSYRMACKVQDALGHCEEGGTLISVNGPESLAAPEGEGEKAAENPLFYANRLELTTEKAEYAPGEKVRLKILTPEGAGGILLFLRSENSVGGEPIFLRNQGPETIYEFTVEEKDQPNIFVEAAIVRNGHFYSAQKEIFLPPEKRILNVEAIPNQETYKPADSGKMTLKITDSQGTPMVGEAVVAIYDKSTDAVAGGSNIPEIRRFFWDWKRNSYPRHSHTLEAIKQPIKFQNKKEMDSLEILGNFLNDNDRFLVVNSSEPMPMMGVDLMSAAAPMPGRAKMAALDRPIGNSEDGVMEADAAAETSASSGEAAAIRKDFADTALWIGRIKTNEKGEAQIDFPLPENLTTWRIRVWAFAPGTRVGEGEASVVTRKDLILRMQRPRFLTQTDEIILSANVHNYLLEEKRVTVTLETAEKDGENPLPLTDGEASQSVAIPAGGETRVDWRVKAERVGDFNLVMKAVTDGESDGVLETIPIYVHGITKQEAFSGMMAASAPNNKGAEEKNVGEETWTMTVPAKRIPDQTKLTVRFSPSLAGAMIDALPYLAEYPYGCTEQTLNRFLPTVITQRVLTDLGVDLSSLAETRANLNAQELGGADARRKEWNQRHNIFGEKVSAPEGTEEKNPVYNPAEIRRYVSAGVNRLSEFQCDDGGWGWFGGYGEHSSSHLTSLVARGLLTARLLDENIPEGTLSRGFVWLTNDLMEETKRIENGEMWSAEAKKEDWNGWKDGPDASDVFVFQTLNFGLLHPQEAFGEAGANVSPEFAEAMAKMKEYIWRDRTVLSPYALSLYGLALCDEGREKNADRLAAILRMLGQFLREDAENQTAWLDLRGATCWGRGGWLWWAWFGDEIETQAAYLRLLIRQNPADATAPKLVKYLLTHRKNAVYWNSTRDTAFCLEAFAEYLKATGEMTQPLTVEVFVDGNLQKKTEFLPGHCFEADNTLEITGDALSDGEHSITVRKTGAGPLYYNAYLENFTLEDFIKAASAEVGVTRKYWRIVEKSVDVEAAGGHGQVIRQNRTRAEKIPLEDGEIVKSGDLIEVELIVTSKNQYESILIEDRKPAGFEAVETQSGYRWDDLHSYAEFRDERVCFFVYRLPQGTHTLSYRLRAETPGRVSALPAKVEGMYAPEQKGNSDEFKTEVSD